MVDCCFLAAGERLIGESTCAFSLKRSAKMRELQTKRV
jgi:non-ribosomal peptide synthetase component E (peptide arylation enzyme)